MLAFKLYLPYSYKKQVTLVNHRVSTARHVTWHEWRTSDTSYRQLYGMPAKIQMKIWRSHSGFHLFLILIC